MLGTCRGLNAPKIAALLSKTENEVSIRLSAYGYITHLLYTKGAQAALNTTLLSQTNVNSYADRAVAERDSIATLLLNALEYFESLMASSGIMDVAMHHMQRMTEPHILYLLLADSFKKYAAKYKDSASEYFRRFPGSADSLPKEFKEQITRLEINDSPDEGGAGSAPHSVL